MPRKSRIDAPGALHHIIARGIEQRPIFQDDGDRKNFLERLGTALQDNGTPCYAWALLPNHFHLLLRTGSLPISVVMRRVLTGYAVTYNLRHNRKGHLFQNRFKSILCQEDTYFLELVRYIHLNPLRAEIIPDMESLDRFPFCGHGNLMAKNTNDWQDTNSVLRFFGRTASKARAGYRRFVSEGIARGRRPELIGGGWIRSVGGWEAVKRLRKTGAYQKGDERILGDGEFVEDVLAQAEEAMKRKGHLKSVNFDKLVDRVAGVMELKPAEVLSPGRYPQISAARSLLCFWAVRELGMTQNELAVRFGLSQPAICVAVQRGENLAEARHFSLGRSE